jgi:hypothetical protein
MMDTIERATRWFFAGRNAWVLWPVGIIAVVLAIAGTGVLNGLVLGTFLIVVPLAWLVGLLGVGTRDHVRRVRAAGNQLLREAGIPALWASLYTLPVWAITDWMVALLWWLLVVYRDRAPSAPRSPAATQIDLKCGKGTPRADAKPALVAPG